MQPRILIIGAIVVVAFAFGLLGWQVIDLRSDLDRQEEEVDSARRRADRAADEVSALEFDVADAESRLEDTELRLQETENLVFDIDDFLTRNFG